MGFRAVAALVILAAPGGCHAVDSPPSNGNGGNGGNGGPAADVVVTVDTLQRFQTITGWEAVAQAGHEKPDFSAWRDELFDKAVNELGINRLRLELKAGSENSTDYYVRTLTGQSADPRCERYTVVNDNADPNVIAPSGFHFSQIDSAMVNVVVPMKQRLEARGEKLFLNLNYVAFLRQCPAPVTYAHRDPAEYAEIMLAAFLHLKARYGFVPDAIEIILEPDNVSEWNGNLVGRAIVSTAARLAANGFRPAFIGPSTTSMANAVTWTRQMYLVPGVAALLSEISYHRYAGVSETNLLALAEIATTNGTSTAMLEHIGSGVDDLYADLTLGRASAWQQFTLAFGAGDGGGQYYQIVDNKPQMGSRTRYLRQYFRYVRMGARRVTAVANNTDLRVVAFQNKGGGLAIVMHTRGSGTIEVKGLAAGRYGASVTTSDLTGSELGEKTASATGAIVVTSPGEGVLTIYRK